MSLKPRLHVEDQYVDGLHCAICESPDLHVVHVDGYPDFVSCGNCESAFVVEDEGSWIMYGKINADLPDTQDFAIRQWTWLDAVRERARDEREVRGERILGDPESVRAMETDAPSLDAQEQEATEPPSMTTPSEQVMPEEVTPSEPEETVEPSPLEDPPSREVQEDVSATDQLPTEEFIDELTQWEKPFPPKEDTKQPSEAVEPDEDADPFAELIPDSPSEVEQQDQDREGPAIDALFPEAEEFMGPGEIPIHTDRSEVDEPGDEVPSADDELVQLDRLEQMPPSAEVSELEGAPKEEPPEFEDLPVPDWLEGEPSAESTGEETIPPFTAAPGEETQIGEDQPTPPFTETDREQEPSAREERPPFVPTPSQEAGPQDLLEDIQPEGAIEEMEGIEEVDEPLDEHLVPPWAREDTAEGELDVEAVSAPERTHPERDDIVPMDSEQEEAEVKAAPIEVDKRPAEEPEEGFRYRVVVKGDKLTFPKNVCAHCLQMPVSLAAAVRGSLPDPEQPGMRKPLTFKLPLCRDCENRAKASTEEERSAKIQAHIISGIVAVFLLIIALVSGIAQFEPNAFEGIMVLLIVGVLGYGIPAILLLNRASNFPPPYDAAFVLTTLRVADDAGEGATAFEWRNQGYAELFRQVNRKNAEPSITKVDDIMMLLEPEAEQGTEQADEGTQERVDEELHMEVDSVRQGANDLAEEEDSARMEALEKIWEETETTESSTDETTDPPSETPFS